MKNNKEEYIAEGVTDMQIPIVSKDNKTLKTIRALQRKKVRLESRRYFAEGVRMVEEALRWADGSVELLIVSDTFAEKNKNFVHALDENGKTVYTAKETLFREVCNTEAPQGIGAVLKMPENTGIEPGNLGTIIRTAEAAGVDAVILLKGCADLYNPKVVRATMGSLFRVPCVLGAEVDMVRKLKEQGFSVAATALKDSIPIGEAKLSGKRALVIGSEAFGVSEEVLALSDLRVRIPMEGQVESLNAGVAAGISMYLLKP